MPRPVNSLEPLWVLADNEANAKAFIRAHCYPEGRVTIIYSPDDTNPAPRGFTVILVGLYWIRKDYSAYFGVTGIFSAKHANILYQPEAEET